MKAGWFVTLICFGLHAAAQGPSSGLPKFQHVFLFDVSGSMASTIGPPHSAARAFLSQGLYSAPRIFEEGQPVVAYSFTVAGKESREYEGALRRKALQELLENRLAVTRRDTDLVHALAMAESSMDRTGKRVTLAWILTDNANDPHGSGADIQNTRSFYEAMFREGSPIRRMYFFPLKDYRLVLYLLVCSPDPSLRGLDLDAFEDALRGIETALRVPRIRAKPVGGDSPLQIDNRIVFSGDAAGVTAEVIGAGRRSTMVVHGLREGEPLRGTFRLRVRSRFDEWRVEGARIETTRLEGLESADFPDITGRMSASLTPNGLAVNPRSATSIVYALELGASGDTPAPKAPLFTWAAFNPQGFGEIRGKLVVKIGQPRLKLNIFNDPATTAAVRSIFHLEDIEYFVPRAAAEKEMRLDFVQPLEFEIAYAWGRRWAAAGGIFIALLLAALFLRRALVQAVACRLLGYSDSTIVIRGAQPFPIAPDGMAIAELRKSIGGGIECRPYAGTTINGQSAPVKAGHGADLELRNGEKSHRYTLEIVSQAESAGTKAGISKDEYF